MVDMLALWWFGREDSIWAGGEEKVMEGIEASEMATELLERCRIYVFFRGDMFYPLELRDDADAVANAEYNPGTTRVEHVSGRLVWGRK